MSTIPEESEQGTDPRYVKWRERDRLILRALTEIPEWWERRIAPRILLDPSGCWLWTASTTPGGYGRVKVPSALGVRPTFFVVTHRVALVRDMERPLGIGLMVDHLCRIRLCCNPAHLRQVTNRENQLAQGSESLSANNAAKTHCPNGHLLIVGNLVASKETRECLTCNMDRGREYREQHKETIKERKRDYFQQKEAEKRAETVKRLISEAIARANAENGGPSE